MKGSVTKLAIVSARTLLAVGVAVAATTNAEKGPDGRVKAFTRYENCMQTLIAKAYIGVDPDQSKFSKCRERYATSWARLANLTGSICEGVRWVDNGDQTVTDNLTGLVWEQKTLAAGVTSGANGLPSEAWDVDFDFGCVNCQTKTETFPARAVRGGLF